MFRFASLAGVTLAVAFAAGCSSSDESGVAGASASAPTTERVDARSDTATTVVPTAVPTTTLPDEPQIVAVEVRVPDDSIDTTVSVDAEEAGDPFDDDFATCSAYRSVAGAYAVGVGGPDAELPWVSIVSAARIDGAGDVDADVRVDLPDGRELVAVGTMTLDADLASGTFAASTAEGVAVEGSFECAGSERPPITMAATDDGAIEVVALIDRDGRERVVTAATLDADAADCPADPTSVVVRVDGDSSLGAISMFEIDQSNGAAVMNLRVGATTYEFDDVVLELDDADRVGTFAAGGDVAVVGAFSCT